MGDGQHFEHAAAGALHRVELVDSGMLSFGHQARPKPTRSAGGWPVGRAFRTAAVNVGTGHTLLAIVPRRVARPTIASVSFLPAGSCPASRMTFVIVLPSLSNSTEPTSCVM